MEELRSKLADVSISSSVSTLQSSREFSHKSIANKEEVNYFSGFNFKKGIFMLYYAYF